jgi:SEC-C motif-containing protein
MKCACGSNEPYTNCCEPFIRGKSYPETAEALMRSRYTAYTLGEIPYIKTSLAPESQSDFDPASTKEWADKAEWLGLKILAAKNGKSDDKKGTVEFLVTYKQDGKTYEHHEVSKFRKNSKGHWLFLEGDAHVHEEGQGHVHHEKQKPVVRDSPKVGRNDPCPCGSGKKYKQCCVAA